MDSDILCLTETQLVPDHDTSDISSKLHDFYISFNSDNDKFRSIACAIKRPASMYHEKFPVFSLVTIKKRSFVDCDIVLEILYRKNACSLNFFMTILQF